MNTEIETITIKGTVVFLFKNENSKSEGYFPYLYVNKEEKHKVFFKDDNPFQNTILLPYDGKFIEVQGHFKPNGTFLIEKINHIDNSLKVAYNETQKKTSE